MGCVESRSESELQSNSFNVVHINEGGRGHKSVRLEVTDAYLVLHQKTRTPIRWPLRCLRRYGFDAEQFSFESGRRCRTGPGVYTFKCKKAEALFNMLQVQIRNIADDATSREFWPVNHEAADDTSGYLPPISRNVNRPPAVGMMPYPGSNGGIPNMGNFSSELRSPSSPSVIAMPPPLFANDDVTSEMLPISEQPHPPPTPGLNAPQQTPLERNSVISYLDGALIFNQADRPPSYSSSGSDRPISVINPMVERSVEYAGAGLDMSYVNIEAASKQSDLKRCRTHLYENVDTDRRDDEHVYANLCPDKRGAPSRASLPSGSAGSGSSNSATTDTELHHRRINYIHLDLDKGSDSSQTAPLSPLDSVQSGFMPEHHSREAFKGYAQIDIAKTEALAAMRETRGDNSRRTRHNSTVTPIAISRQICTLSD